MVAKEANPKIQHYVPQYYLRGFVNERRKLHVVDRPRATFFRVPTNKVGAELYFNLVAVNGINPFAVEDALSELEGKVAPIVARVMAARSLGRRKRSKRDPEPHRLGDAAKPEAAGCDRRDLSRSGQFAAAAGLQTKERYGEFAAAMKAQGNAAPAYEEIKGWLEKEPELFEPPPPPREFNILEELRSNDHLVELYDGIKWLILVASDDSGGFVTSDHPVPEMGGRSRSR